MDDFNLSTLTESRNEYCALLLSKITPFIIQGIYSIFNEANKLCYENDEEEKYLMTFQNFLARITKWNQEIINNETERIIKTSGCNYLEDLLTCVHVTQLKLLTSVRVGSKQKKIDIDIPKLNNFIHQIYIHLARKVYKNVFLFDKNAPSLQQQKNMRELEIIVKECILGVIRDTMPLETILRSYLDETHEEDVEEIIEEVRQEIKEELEGIEKQSNNSIDDNINKIENIDTKSQLETHCHDNKDKLQGGKSNEISSNDIIEKQNNHDEKVKELEDKITNTIISTKEDTNMDIIKKPEILVKNVVDHGTDPVIDNTLRTNFNDNDKIVQYNPKDETTLATKENEKTEFVSKSIDNLEKISDERWRERAEDVDEDEEDDGDEFKLKIFEDANIQLDELDIHNIEKPIQLNIKNILDDDIIELH